MMKNIKKGVAALIAAALTLSPVAVMPTLADDTTSITINPVSTVATAYSNGSFTFEEKGLPDTNVKIIANEDITHGGQTYHAGDTVDSGKASSPFSLSNGEYKAVPYDSNYFKTSDAQVFGVSGESKTVKVEGSVHQSHSIAVSNAKEGFTYELKAAEDIKDYKGNVICASGTVIGTKSGANAVFENLPIERVYNGKYIVSEKTVPSGYFKATDVTSKGNEDAQVSFDEKTTKTKIKLVDDNGNAIDDDGFELGVLVDGEEKPITDMFLKALTPGEEYTVKSKKVPDGYLPFTERVTIGESEKETTATITVKSTIVKLSALDTDGSLVPGCTLVVKKDDKVITTFTSGNEPKTAKKLAAGDYTLEMKTAAKGYCVGSPVSFTVENTEDVQEAKINVVRPKGYVKITLVSVVNRTPLSGATFEYKDKDGKIISKLTTDKKGQAKTDMVEIGEYANGVYTGRAKYTLTETKSAKGYVCDTTEYKLLFDYVDDQTPEVHIEATLPNRSETGEPVKTKLVARQYPSASNVKGGGMMTGDKRFLLVIAGIVVIIALIALTVGPDIAKKRKLKNTPTAKGKAEKAHDTGLKEGGEK